MRRMYMVAFYDVTDLTEDEQTFLAGELDAQSERSEGHPSVGVVIGTAHEGGDEVQHVGIFIDAGIEIGAVVKPSTIATLDLTGTGS